MKYGLDALHKLVKQIWNHGHSGFPAFVKEGGLDFWTQRNSRGTEIFQNWGGEEKEGGKWELLKSSLWGTLLKMKLQTESILKCFHELYNKLFK